MAGYDFTAIEKKWQTYWDENGTFVQPNPGQDGFDADKPKYYVLDMFPYPSGAGLHVGHPVGYVATDVVARYRRMKGFNVLHPMGYDAFGLPAEQYAVEHGVHPRITTERNIANMERQLRMFGFSYDWSRRLATTDPGYYRWTQWIFHKMFNSWYDPAANAARPIAELVEKLESGELLVDLGGNVVGPPISENIRALAGEAGGHVRFAELDTDQRLRLIDEYRLAYMDEVPVNWCPALGTVLSNEEVTNEGRSDRGDHPVYRRPLRQWMLRITAYAERLLADLDLVDWPEPIKLMQRNWIGKSTGAEVDFPILSRTGVSPVAASATPAFKKHTTDKKLFFLSAHSFCSIDPDGKEGPPPEEVIERARHLPHIEAKDATYFVTFNARDEGRLDLQERELVLKACLHWHGSRCILFACVVMPTHVHMVVRPTEQGLSNLMHSIKSYTAHEINKRRGTSGPVWIEESFDHVVRNKGWFTSFIKYVCDNPVKEGLAPCPDDYPWLYVNPDEVHTHEGESFGKLPGTATDESIDEWFRQRQESGFPEVPDTGAPDADRRDACRTLRVYTTRPDTLFGATYMVLAPEHPLVEAITTDAQRDQVQAYVAAAARKSELERTAETKEKTGVFTGAYAVNPVNREKVPVWIADYVMMGYGTGAIMAVPAHDTRDLEFAEKFDLPVVQVVEPPAGQDWRGFVGEGTAVNSGKYDGQPTAEMIRNITADLEKAGLGRGAVNYKLRDWLFSRQRYWGEPFPIVHCPACGPVTIPEEQLPLALPEMDDFTPAASDDPTAPPSPPLEKSKDWVTTTCPVCGEPSLRETNTMPQWAGSCWYYLRFCDPKNDKAFVGEEAEQYWMKATGSRQQATETEKAAGSSAQAVQSKIENRKSKIGGVDLYVGGAEHAVLHLLYARFWHKVLYDLGCVSGPEPFGRLFNQGMIRSFAYRDKRGVCIPYEDVDDSGEKPVQRTTGEALSETVEKMSKSLKNVVNPDDVIAGYGADTFRLYEMFMGPLDASKPWNTRDVPGLHRFLNRVWRMIVGDEDTAALLTDSPGDEDVEVALHRLIRKVGADCEALKLNTAIAAMMEFVNAVYKAGAIRPDQAERFVLVLAPFAPHVAEELWQRLGHDESLAREPWPGYDEKLIAEETIDLPVQVNGKLRGRASVPADAAEQDIIDAAMADPKVAAAVAGKQIVKTIVVPGRMVNIVVK